MRPPVPPGEGEGAAGSEIERDVLLDKPGIVGARWWHKALVAEGQAMQRRSVLKGLAVAGGVMGALALTGVGLVKLGGSITESTSLATRPSLDMQRQYGWDFGARGTPLVFDGVSEGPFERSELEFLASVLAPTSSSRYYVSTLVESLFAKPVATLPVPPGGVVASDSRPFKRVADVLVPIATPAMAWAYRVGEAVARLAGGKSIGLLVDLPGPEAVAFAAGACTAFEPVLLLDNWPHPHGVVPTHLTLAALAYYQPRFAKEKARVSGEPVFVVDRARLSPYSEETDRFDNRYYARMPKLQALRQDGLKGLLYVVANEQSLPEPADLNAVLSAPDVDGPGIPVKALALAHFGKPESGDGPVLYGGSAVAEESFAARYLGEVAPQVSLAPPTTLHEYRFVPRDVASHTPPSNLGQVAVLVTASGLLVAAALDRRGSMNRFSGGWSG